MVSRWLTGLIAFCTASRSESTECCPKLSASSRPVIALASSSDLLCLNDSCIGRLVAARPRYNIQTTASPQKQASLCARK